MPRLSFLLPALLLALSACSGQQAPRPATLLPEQPAHADFDALRVHYSLLPTLAMNESVARDYGVERKPDRALLVVALRQRVGDEEQSIAGEVSATATDLSGKRQSVALRPVQVGSYTDLIGVVDAHPNDQLRVELQVDTPAGRGKVRFERGF